MTVRLVLALVYVGGALLTVVNGFLAFRSTEQRLRRYAGRIVHSDRYEKERDGGAQEIQRRGHPHPTDGSAPAAQQPLTAHELAQHLVDSFYENRVALVLAGVGLLLTTAASVVALFL